MEKAYEMKKIKEEFEKKRLQNMSEFEARAHKRAEKRRRRKERTKAKSLSSGGDGAEEEDEDRGEDDSKSGGTNEGEPTQKKQKVAADAKAEVLPETPGGVPEIPNDGSFLERMLAEQKKKEQQQ